MKKAVLLLLCCLSISLAYTQNIFLGGKLEDYTGTWRYENKDSNLVFTIKLKKSKMELLGKVYDCAIGTYSLVKNGVTITDNMHKFDTLSDPYLTPILLVDYSKIYATLELSFRDELYKKHTASGTLSLIPLKNGKFNLHWILKEDEGDYVYDWNEVIPPDGFSVPDNAILVKIE